MNIKTKKIEMNFNYILNKQTKQTNGSKFMIISVVFLSNLFQKKQNKNPSLE